MIKVSISYLRKKFPSLYPKINSWLPYRSMDLCRKIICAIKWRFRSPIFPLLCNKSLVSQFTVKENFPFRAQQAESSWFTKTSVYLAFKIWTYPEEKKRKLDFVNQHKRKSFLGSWPLDLIAKPLPCTPIELSYQIKSNH